MSSSDYWGDFDYCDSIAIVGSTIAIVVILLRYYCDSCDTIEYIEFSGLQWFNGVYIKTWRGLFDGEFLLVIYLSF